MMNEIPLMPASLGWDQDLETMVLPMSLSDFMDAFWADDAPFYIPGMIMGKEKKIVNYTKWGEPNIADKWNFGEDVKSTRAIEKEFEYGIWSGVWSTIQSISHVALLEATATKITIMIMETQSGFTYSDKYQDWYKYEIMTTSEDSKQVVVRKQSALRWLEKPWVTWRYINSWAIHTLEQNSEVLKRHLEQGAERFANGPPYTTEGCTERDFRYREKVRCMRSTLPEQEPVEPWIIRDGSSSDFDAWSNSWTCNTAALDALGVDKNYSECMTPEERKASYDNPWAELEKHGIESGEF